MATSAIQRPRFNSMFVITEETDTANSTGVATTYNLNMPIELAGYYPLAIVGYWFTGSNYSFSNLTDWDIKSATGGSGVIEWVVANRKSGTTITSTIHFHVLWQKVA